jgi:uncharacterized protein DUF6893
MSKGLILGLALVGGVGAIVASQQPEIRRYLKIRSM